MNKDFAMGYLACMIDMLPPEFKGASEACLAALDQQAIARVKVRPAEYDDSILNKPIKELEMSKRSYNALTNPVEWVMVILSGTPLETCYPVKTVGDLVQFPERKLLMLPNFGRKSLNELKSILKEHGLRFKLPDEF